MSNHFRKEKVLLEILETTDKATHLHQDIELIYVIEGKLDVKLDKQISHLKKHDVIIINANLSHTLMGSDDVLYARISIFYEMVSDVLKNLSLVFVCDSTKIDNYNYDNVRRIIDKLIKNYICTKEKGINFAYISLCYSLMDEISKNFLIQSTAVSGNKEKDKYEVRLQEIDNYLSANFRTNISIKDLSEKMYLSEGYLSRFFKKNYGMSFAQYLTGIRLRHAVDELLYTDFPVVRIVYDNGFANVASFNRAFKAEYGETPSQMRERAMASGKQDNRQVSEHAYDRLQKMIWNPEDSDEDDLTSKEYEVDMTAHCPLKNIWSEVINVGTAFDMSKSEIREHVIILHEALKFKYVRFWNPFSKELLIDINSTDRQYNFSRLDAIIDFLLETGIKPFFELANKPQILTSNVKKSLLYEICESVDNDSNWEAVMDAFMRHVVSRYGREEISSWKFELWFDFNLITNPMMVISYARRMEITHVLVKKYCDAQVGGCGMQGITRIAEDKTEYILKFYKTMAERQFIPDFVSYYFYAYDSYYEGNKIYYMPCSDQDFVKHAFLNTKKISGDEVTEVPICISEWNITVSDRNYINDTCFKAAYVMKNYIDMVGKVDSMVYFRGTDRGSEFYDTNSFLFGGMGLLTKDGVLKPAAFAIDFLNRLYPDLVVKGENYLVSADGHGAYGIVCHNFKGLSSNYYYTQEDQLSRDNMAMYIEDMDPMKLCLKLKGVADGNYQSKIYRINEDNGSVFNIWQELGYENDLTRNDIKYFRRKCEPRLSIQRCDATAGILRLEVNMQPNEIVYIRLVRKDQI